MSDDQHWSDPRWGDPATRAHLDSDPAEPAPYDVGDVWAAPAAEAAPPSRRRLTPLVAGIVGIALGAALGVPVGLSHRSPSQAVSQPSLQIPIAPNGGTSSDNVAAQVDRSIVDITSRLGYQRAVAAGTGMVITAGGDILTNNHVIEGATSITVTTVIDGRSYTANVVGTDPTEDVAVLRLTHASNLTAITVGDSSKVGVGDQVVALGNAGGVGGTPAVATGQVTALGQQITATDSNGNNPQHLTGLIETDAAIRPGDSGGPLANMRAQVIGMDTAASLNGGFGGGTGRGFAIPIQHALDIAHQIQAGQGSSTVHIGTRGMIGVQVADVSTAGSGADVVSVTPGSPADKAGIHAGDRITAIDGQQVTTPDALGKLIKAHAAGDRVTVTWTSSDGTGHTSTVTLVAGPPD